MFVTLGCSDVVHLNRRRAVLTKVNRRSNPIMYRLNHLLYEGTEQNFIKVFVEIIVFLG